MKWEMASLADGYRKVRVEVPWEEIAPDYDDILQDFMRLQVAGFRPGKAPRQVVEGRFRREISDQLSQRCARRLCRLALEQAATEAAGPVEVSEVEWERGQPFRFTARFFPLPQFELPDYRSLNPGAAAGEDPQGELSRRLLNLVDLQIPDELVRAELAVDGLWDCEPGSEAWQAAAQQVKLMLILKRIAREEGIEVEEADVDRRIKEKAAEFGTTADALRAELEKGGGRPRLKDLLLAESVLGYLLENLQGKEE
jgi:FKBP-type peptidyl-prolyl cis-trans isomerase (trigger factor)